jgi:hypothetical protein
VLGLPVDLDGLAPCHGVGYWRMLQPPCDALTVHEADGLDELAEETFVDSIQLKRAPGEPVDWREGTDGAVAVVRGRVRDLDELATAIAHIDSTVTIECERVVSRVGTPVG